MVHKKMQVIANRGRSLGVFGQSKKCEMAKPYMGRKL